MFIYAMENEINGKVYVGQARNLRARELAHRRGKCGCVALANSINKYGQENFIFNVLDTCVSQEEMDSKEKHWIEILGTLVPGGYNIKEGGSGGGPCSEETKVKISKANKGKKRTLEHRELLRRLNLGKKLSEETKHKLRQINLGKKMSPESIEKTRQFWIGRKHSESSKQKMSESSKGFTHTAQSKEKIRQAMLGRTHSAETILRMRTSAQERVKKGLLRRSCKHGHAMTTENTYIPPGKPNQRQCRACLRINSTVAYARRSSQ